MQRMMWTKLTLTAVAAASMPAAMQAQTVPVTTAAAQPVAAHVSDDISRFYTASNNAPIWFRAGQAEAGPALVNILRRAPIDGFARGPQLAADVEAALARAQTGDAAAVQAAERIMSAAWISYMRALHAPTPGMLYGEKWVTPTMPSSFDVLRKALHAPSLAQHLEKESRLNPIYGALRETAIKEAALPGGGNSARYAANLERARSIPATGRFVLVDAATARLWMYENGQPVDSMKVVVGKLDYRTPMIASVIWYTTFNPYWHVPDHLVRQTIAVNVQKRGEGYLKQNGYQIVSDYGDNATIIPASSIDWKSVASGQTKIKMRQLPGPTNSMGKMKFNFANPEGIYLHDTPNKAYFKQSNRALSNGCIRLEDAQRLGRWLMGRDPVAPSSSPEQHVQLPQGVPVYVTYLTAQPHLGEVALARDVYGWDARSTVSTAAVMQAAGAGS